MQQRLLLLVSLICLSSLNVLWAVPAYPGWITMDQPDGSTIELRQMGDEFYHFWQNRAGQEVIQNDEGWWVVAPIQLTPQQRQTRRMESPMYRTASDIKKAASRPSHVLVILMNFSDVAMQTKHNHQFFVDMLNKDDSASVREYFKQSSDGHYTPQFDVYGPYTTDSVMAYYGGNNAQGNDLRVGCMIYEACVKAHNDGCNFADYDEDGDGKVDNINVIFAGYSESAGGGVNCIWPNQWNLKDCRNCGGSYYLDGKRLHAYSCSAELRGGSGTNSASIGTFCHEFSHILGMPDYYDTHYGYNNENDMTPGKWSLMDHGNYNNYSQSPPLYSIFDKCYMGWASVPALLAKDAQVTITMPTGSAYARQITGTTSSKPYTSTDTIYYIENRQQSGYFDIGLPGHGMLIWRVLFRSNWSTPNNDSCLLRYTLVSASGSDKWLGTSSDPYPGAKGTTSKTLWPGCTFSQIAENGGNITFNFNGGSTTYTHTWMANGSQFMTTTSRSSLNLPTSSPSACSSTKQFYGWTKQTAIQQDGSDLVLAKAYDEIAANTTFYAVYKTTTSPARYSYQCNDQTYTTEANAKFVIVRGQEIEIGGQTVNTPGQYPYDTIKTINGDSLLAVNLTWADMNKTIVYTASTQLLEVTGTTTYGLHTDKFGQQIMEHYFSNGIGVIAFNNNVTTIGNYAFYGSRNTLGGKLLTVQLPNTVTTIGNYAFNNCWELTTLNIPGGVTSIGTQSFYKCYALTNLRSEALTPPACGSNCFQNATSNIVLYVWPSALNRYQTTAGWKDLTHIRRISCGETPTIIPSTHTMCAGETYTWKNRQLTTTGVYNDTSYTDAYGCDTIIDRLELTVNPAYQFEESATFVKGMTYQWRGKNLTSTGIYYDSLTTNLGCDSVYKLTLNMTDSTKAIIYTANAKLLEVSYYNYGLHLGGHGQPVISHTFQNGVGVVAFANDLTQLGNRAFYQCNTSQGNNLQTVILPKTVTSIGQSAFFACTNLTSVIIPDGVTSFGDSVFNKCRKLREINIPEGVTTMGVRMLNECVSLRNVTIPSTVTSLGIAALRHDSTWTSITCKALTPPTCGESCFQKMYPKRNKTLYVSPSAIDAYRAADGWKDFLIQPFYNTITLSENDQNTSKIVADTYDTIRLECTLYAGRYNTFCVPFAVELDSMARYFHAGCKLYEMTSGASSDDGITIIFDETTGGIEAGTPYLMEVAANVVNPVFTNRTITATTPGYDEKGSVIYQGVYCQTMLHRNSSPMEYFLDSNNLLCRPVADENMKGLRCYFKISTDNPSAPIRMQVNQPSTPTDLVAPSLSGEGRGEALKFIKDNQLIILRDGKRYNAQGQLLNQ